MRAPCPRRKTVGFRNARRPYWLGRLNCQELTDEEHGPGLNLVEVPGVVAVRLGGSRAGGDKPINQVHELPGLRVAMYGLEHPRPASWAMSSSPGRGLLW